MYLLGFVCDTKMKFGEIWGHMELGGRDGECERVHVSRWYRAHSLQRDDSPG